jgi:hypothetical protein
VFTVMNFIETRLMAPEKYSGFESENLTKLIFECYPNVHAELKMV